MAGTGAGLRVPGLKRLGWSALLVVVVVLALVLLVVLIVRGRQF